MSGPESLINMEEREKLYLRRGQGANLREIAPELGRSVATISRELKCNERPRHPYSPSQAQKRYENRRRARGRKHILCDAEMREYIRRFIQEAHWSSEQISNQQVQISSTAIYRAIKSEPSIMRRIPLWASAAGSASYPRSTGNPGSPRPSSSPKEPLKLPAMP